MSPRITVVGCGFVGSIFTHEALRRLNALEVPWDWGFVDMDLIEKRNCNNQNYTLAENNFPKSEVLASYATDFGVEAEFVIGRVQAMDMDDFPLKESGLIVDAVDNLETRQWLWSFGLEHSIPVMHLGITQDGMGKVEWSTKELDNFSLSPIALRGRTDVKDPSVELPPCELARMRGVGLMTGFAGAVSLGHYFGADPEGFVGGTDKSLLTSWTATTSGMTLLPDFTTEVPND